MLHSVNFNVCKVMGMIDPFSVFYLFFSHILQPNHIHPLPFCPFLHISFPSYPVLLHFPLKNSRPPMDINQAWHKSYDKTRHIPSYQGWMRQPNRRKGIPRVG